jgi:hypothetical protein
MALAFPCSCAAMDAVSCANCWLLITIMIVRTEGHVRDPAARGVQQCKPHIPAPAP